MKFGGIYGMAGKAEPKFFLKLNARSDEAVDLVAVDEKGGPIKQGYIAKFTAGGVYLYADLNPKLGFELDGSARIKLLSLP